MILVLSKTATHPHAAQLIDRLQVMGFKAVKEQRDNRIIIAIVSGIDGNTDEESFKHLPLVDDVESFSAQFKLAGKDVYRDRMVVDVRGVKIGAGDLCVMAGPCSIENEDQIHRIAKNVALAGANFLRGGAYKPRTSPYDFQGLGEDGCRFMRDAAQENNLRTISEIMDAKQMEVAARYIDVLQIGTRNMQNFSFLKELGQVKNPIMLKRGFSATYKELLMAAEYILDAGNPNVILCERGIRTFESYTRNTLDLAAVPVLHELSHLPVIVDPSHGTGIRHLVAPMALAGIAAGADGIIVETHYDPDNSYSDAQQTISAEAFSEMMNDLRQIHAVVHKHKMHEHISIGAQ